MMNRYDNMKYIAEENVEEGKHKTHQLQLYNFKMSFHSPLSCIFCEKTYSCVEPVKIFSSIDTKQNNEPNENESDITKRFELN